MKPDDFEQVAKRALDHLYTLPDDCPPAIANSIGLLRQWINEERLGKGKQITSSEIWGWLKDGVEKETRIESVKTRINEVFFNPVLDDEAALKRITELRVELRELEDAA